MMKPLHALLATAAGLAAAPASTPAMAQGGPPPAGDTVTVGLGVGVTTDYDGADEYKLIPGGVLQGTVGGHDFRLNGLQLFVDAIPNDPARTVELELGPVAGLRFNRSGGVKDPQVAALGKLDEAVELGLAGSVGLRGVGSRTGTLSLGTSMVWDVAGAHGAWRLNPSLGYSTVVGRRTFVRAALSATFAPDAMPTITSASARQARWPAAWPRSTPTAGWRALARTCWPPTRCPAGARGGRYSASPASAGCRGTLRAAPSCGMRDRRIRCLVRWG
nr:MipA/OmpV family protein [Alteraurantiacibacter buctensis]